ncbi:unnamed protein product [Gongylonema pulchrum]|uniref:Uncharacterized protein n=1 Tax=Gongylonema pulchrum TaxID=637853 RepID=A0A183EJJ8_9BILA|nr:unnamed protein product [Gongylonema pulchrum]
MKLIEWKDNTKDLRPLAAESCGVEGSEDEEDQDRIFFARKKRRPCRGYRKEQRLSGKSDKDDNGQTPFVPLEETD